MSISVHRIDRAKRPTKSSLWPIISSRIRLTFIISWSRLKTANLEVREASICSLGLSRPRVSSIIYVIDKNTSLLTRRAMI